MFVLTQVALSLLAHSKYAQRSISDADRHLQRQFAPSAGLALHMEPLFKLSKGCSCVGLLPS